MGLLDRMLRRSAAPAPEARALSIESVYGSNADFLAAMGITGGNVDMPIVTIDSALQVPAISAAVTFLSRALAALPLHLFKDDGTSAEKIDTGLAVLLRDAPNDEQSSFAWRQWFWQQVFTGGRGLSWIERSAGGQVVGIWPMDPNLTRIEKRNGRKLYFYQGQADPYPARDVIDVAWMLRTDGLGHYSPIQRGAKSIASSLAIMDYASRLFAKGGIPPVALEGPIGTGADAMKRAMDQVNAAVKTASEANIPMLRLPSGFSVRAIGFNPKDGMMVEARKALNLDHARLYNLPPVFIQDLENATFTNSEQQDLHLVKHVIVQWCEAFEQELNLKLFGRKNAKRYVKHNVDGLLRGDFLSRINGLARAVQSSLMKPNEGRGFLDLPADADPKADQLYMQGATVPVGTNADENGGTANGD